MKTYRVVAGLVILAIIVIVVYHFAGGRGAPQSGITQEKISHQDDLWTVDFTAKMAAPESAVFHALRHPEDVHGASIKSVTVVSDTGDEKIIELVVQGPTGTTVKSRETYHFFPREDRVTFTTSGNPIVSGNAEYRLTPDGGATIIHFHETAKVLIRMELPDMVVRSRIRETAVADLDSLRQRLRLPANTQPADQDEP